MKHPLSVGLGDVGLAASLRAIALLTPFQLPPSKATLDDVALEDTSTWVSALLKATRDGCADWSGEWQSHRTTKLVDIYPRSGRVGFHLPDAFVTLDEGLTWIQMLPFEVCSIGTIFPDEWLTMDVENFGFGKMHSSHGWACAFRGKGHDRLVSRRWLDFGPWRVIRRPDDLTLVQFHDLDVDPETAYRQAHPGHERMGVSKTGGYLQVPYVFSDNVEGLYIAERRTLEIVVPPGGIVEQVRMRDACALRYQHRVEPPAEERIDQVAYVFVDEADARAHLHELWLRELEVWLVDGDGKRRLDLAYQPARVPPAWVAALENRTTT
jgi:hypothetical protein